MVAFTSLLGPVYTLTRHFTLATRHLSSMTRRRYIPSWLEGVENVEEYEPGGLHPMCIGDVLDNGRYAVIHKLGYGGFSTVWLARDLHASPNRLVAIKAMRADVSTVADDEIPEMAISRALQSILPRPVPLRFVDDKFTVRGPNGSHTCLVSSLAGPSVLAMLDCPGRTAGSRRLRADLAKKAARQATVAIHLMHSKGIVHGG